jgi:hypothetical protein
MDDEELVLPFDDLVRCCRGELPHNWLEERIAVIQLRARRFVAEMKILRETAPEIYDRVNKPL